MKNRACAFLAIWFCSCLAAASGVSPAKVEVNLGPFPVDKYLALNLKDDLITPIIPSCPTCWTIKECVRGMFNNNPAIHPFDPFRTFASGPNFVGQGVTGVRFQFDLGGGVYSTPFDANGNVNFQTWVPNMKAFLRDLRSYNIQGIAPTPIMHQPWSSGTQIQVTTCGVSQQFRTSYKWLPFGLTAGLPDNEDPYNAYVCANGNSSFWGWTPFFNLLKALFDTINEVNQEFSPNPPLVVNDFDIDNEVDMANFTVLARLIYDNKHPEVAPCLTSTCDTNGTDVLGHIRKIMNDRNFPGERATYSVASNRPGFITSLPQPPYCNSYYGDSAQLFFESALLGALGGPSRKFGMPPADNSAYKLPCTVTCTDCDLRITLPVAQAYLEPKVTNIHSHVCIEQSASSAICRSEDPTTTATALYNAVWTLLNATPLPGSPARTGNRVVFGETNHNSARRNVSAPGCLGLTLQGQAAQNVNGFRVSQLFTLNAANVALRIWHDQVDAPSCFGTGFAPVLPSLVNPPYDPRNP